METKLQRLEVETTILRDHDFSVEHASRGKLPRKCFDELREIPVEGLLVAALNEQLVAVAEDERAEAIPFRLENPVVAGRQVADSIREHRQHGRVHGQV